LTPVDIFAAVVTVNSAAFCSADDSQVNRTPYHAAAAFLRARVIRGPAIVCGGASTNIC
jgi:hypothetical protein